MAHLNARSRSCYYPHLSVDPTDVSKPRLTAVDVPSWRRLILLWALAVAATAYFILTDSPLDDDAAIVALGATLLLPLQAWYGSRRVELFTDRIRVTRRGKIRLEKPLIALRLIPHVPFTDAYWLWFGGSRIVFIPANSASFAALLRQCRTMLEQARS